MLSVRCLFRLIITLEAAAKDSLFLDKTFRMYKSSTLGFSRSNQALDISGSVEPEGDSGQSASVSGKGSSPWDDEAARECKLLD